MFRNGSKKILIITKCMEHDTRNENYTLAGRHRWCGDMRLFGIVVQADNIKCTHAMNAYNGETNTII